MGVAPAREGAKGGGIEKVRAFRYKGSMRQKQQRRVLNPNKTKRGIRKSCRAAAHLELGRRTRRARGPARRRLQPALARQRLQPALAHRSRWWPVLRGHRRPGQERRMPARERRMLAPALRPVHRRERAWPPRCQRWVRQLGHQMGWRRVRRRRPGPGLQRRTLACQTAFLLQHQSCRLCTGGAMSGENSRWSTRRERSRPRPQAHPWQSFRLRGSGEGPTRASVENRPVENSTLSICSAPRWVRGAMRTQAQGVKVL